MVRRDERAERKKMYWKVKSSGQGQYDSFMTYIVLPWQHDDDVVIQCTSSLYVQDVLLHGRLGI